MLKSTLTTDLIELIEALDATCSGLRDPNRVRVEKGHAILAYLEELLPPDPDPDDTQLTLF
jgi:hypothetical protein